MALIVILLFMATLAVGGLYSARSALLGERVARNQLDNQVARQAAEAALRDAEIDLSIASGATARAGALCARGIARPLSDGWVTFQPDCPQGQCAGRTTAERLNSDYAEAGSEGVTGEPWWPEGKGGKWDGSGNKTACSSIKGGVRLGTFTGTPELAGVKRQPEYIIEQFRRSNGGGTSLYRITARGFGYRESTEVVMQSYFKFEAGI